jgi:hypothetical protein
MQFKNIIETWCDSFSLLVWKELRLLGLMSLNSFQRALKLTIKYFWWLWLLWFIFLMLPSIFGVILTPHRLFDSVVLEKIPSSISLHRLYDIPLVFWTFTAITCMFSVINLLVDFTYYLSTRASIEAKNCSYYRLYFSKILFFLFVQVMVNVGLALPITTLSLFNFSQGIVSTIEFIIHVILAPLPLLIGYVFLDFDGKKILNIIKCGGRLFILFLPLLFMWSLFYSTVLFSLYGITTYLLSLVSVSALVVSIIFGLFFIQALVLTLLFYSCCATLYLKIKHTRPQYFFI